VGADWLALKAERFLRFCKADEFNGDDSALMQKLEETVLSVCSWLTKVYNSSLILDFFSFCVDPLTVAFHVKLLNVRGELAQSLAIWDNSSG